MSTEAQKRASKKYFLTHREYYREKTKESIKRIRQERKEYKQRIDDAIEYINNYKQPLHHSFDEPDCDYWIATNPDDLLNILQNGSEE